MKAYNVMTHVVGIVHADSAEDAKRIHEKKLSDAGFEVFTDTGYQSDAFESEPLDDVHEHCVKPDTGP